jgi:hypothetical protein
LKAQGIFFNTRARLIQRHYRKYKARRVNDIDKKQGENLINESLQEPIKSITNMSTFH